MTLETGLLFAVLAVMVVLFLTERLPIDLTAFAGLVALVLLGYVTPDEAFQGFASPAVITMIAMFVVSGSLGKTGVADWAARRAHGALGSREAVLIVAIMWIAATLSAFMNNLGATAVLMPAVAAIARRAGLAPSRLFMPLAVGAIIGGTSTLVGGPSNIVAAELVRERGLEPFGLFEFTPPAAILLAVATLYMLTVGRRLVPDRDPLAASRRGEVLVDRFGLRRGISIRVPPDSRLAGRTLGEAHLGTALGVQVVAIERGDERRLAPSPDTRLRAGDRLELEGRVEEIRELLGVRDVEVVPARLDELPRPAGGVGGLRATIRAGSPHVGRTLRELRFRERFGVVVVGVSREDRILRERLAEIALRPGDRLLALGERERIQAFSRRPEFEDVEAGLAALEELSIELFVIHMPDGSALAGRTIAESRFGELAGVTVGGIVRADEMLLGCSPTERIEPGDRLLLAGEPSRVRRLQDLGDLEIVETEADQAIESEEVGLVEAVIAPRAGIAGYTLAELAFRERYGLQVLAIEREGGVIHRDVSHVSLRIGDVLLLQGPYERIELLNRDADFLLLSELAWGPRRTRRAPAALAGLGLMIAMVVTGWQPIHVASFTAATIVLLSGAIRMEEAYRAIEWRVVFLVAAVLPVGVAMERTGAALLLADGVTGVTGASGPYVVLGVMAVLSSVFAQAIDGSPAVVLLAPVVFEAADALGANPRSLMMGVTLAASMAFMTPFGHKVNLLVMGAGGYRSSDYLRIGTPLTIVLLALIVVLVPLFFPL